jgi:hypothetical protein
VTSEASLERALELSEPEGIVLPYILLPVQDLLERLPRHHIWHATLRQTILDVLAGSAPEHDLFGRQSKGTRFHRPLRAPRARRPRPQSAPPGHHGFEERRFVDGGEHPLRAGRPRKL